MIFLFIAMLKKSIQKAAKLEDVSEPDRKFGC